MRKIKYIMLTCFTFLLGLSAQEYQSSVIHGEITFLSSQNVYVKFPSTSGIAAGDTLFKRETTGIKPALIVQYISSFSCAGPAISLEKLVKGDTLLAFISQQVSENVTILPQSDEKEEVYKINKNNKTTISNSNIRGRFTSTSYTTLSNYSNSSDQRWRYLLSLQGDNINDGPLSFDTYISFRYKNSQWVDIKNNIGQALKIYAFSVKYDFSKSLNLTLGRNFNKWITNIGVNDGLQLHYRLNNYHTGFIIGSRPNISDYGYNLKMFQFGAYLGRIDTLRNGLLQNSLAFMQQMNNSNIDRRFIYFQHSNSSIKNINLFLSSEIDLYKKTNGNPQTQFDLTSLYVSLNYRPLTWLSLNGSYDNRKNVIYYETYKTFADSLLDTYTRQGLRFRTTVRLFRGISVYGNYGFRHREGDSKNTKNFGFGTSISRVPILNSSLSMGYTGFDNIYSTGTIIRTNINKEILPGIVSMNLGYRWLKYEFSSMSGFQQNVLSADVNINYERLFYLSLYYEGTFQSVQSSSRFVINFTTRF